MAAAFVWFVPGEYAVYFEAQGGAQAWAYVKAHKKRWAQSYDLPEGQDFAYPDPNYPVAFESYPSTRLGREWPGVVEQTPHGTLYSALPGNWAPPWNGRERWTTIHTNGITSWVEIADHLEPDKRSLRNSERQRFVESVDANEERRNKLSLEGWQRVRHKP